MGNGSRFVGQRHLSCCLSGSRAGVIWFASCETEKAKGFIGENLGRATVLLLLYLFAARMLPLTNVQQGLPPPSPQWDRASSVSESLLTAWTCSVTQVALTGEAAVSGHFLCGILMGLGLNSQLQGPRET